MKYKVRSFDVLGHNSTECINYDCSRCIKEVIEIDGDNREVRKEHDDDRCSCGYDINDVFNIGEIECDGSNEGILDALIENDYLHLGTTMEMICFDNDLTEGAFEIYDMKDGTPILQLERQR